MLSIHSLKIQLVIIAGILFYFSGYKDIKVSAKTEQEKKNTPNIVLILVDDLGYMDTHTYGSKFYETPNIDKLAKQGMMFTNAYASAANCAPSRACLLSGKNTPRHGIYTVNNSDRGKSERRKLIPTSNTSVLGSHFVTVAEKLQGVGYVTSSIGKWHLGESPKSQGFDINIGGTHKGHPKSYFSPYNNKSLINGPEGEYLTDRLTSEALNFIKDNKKNKFFLYLPYYTVHTPLQGKKEVISKYKNKKTTTNQKNAIYAAMIESMDENVGKIMESLDKLKLSENTIVFFCSDNGGVRRISSQYPLRAGKGSYYEGGIRVPLIIKWQKKIGMGKICNVPVTNLDFFPTIMDIAKIKKTKNEILDGDNLVPLLLKKGKFNKNRALFWHFPIYLQTNVYNLKDGRDPYFRTRPGSVVRKGKWKLHEYFEDNALELYNLETDQGEINNLSETYPEIVEKLHNLLIDWRKTMEAPVPDQLNPEYNPNYKN